MTGVIMGKTRLSVPKINTDSTPFCNISIDKKIILLKKNPMKAFLRYWI
jgi:hypothetical protein